MPMPGRDHGLMRAALWREADAGGRRRHHEARARVERVVERVQPPGDEGIVQRADGQQRIAPQRAGEAQRPEQQEEVVLGDAELDVLAGGRLAPLHRLGHLGEGILARGTRVHAFPVDPPGEVGRDRDVGGYRHHTVARGQAAESAEHAAERLLGGGRARMLVAERRGNLHGGAARRRRPIERRARADEGGLGAVRREARPLLARSHAGSRAERVDLAGGEEGAVVHGIGGHR